MLNSLFANLLTDSSTVTPTAFLLCILAALILGLISALSCTYRARCSRSFIVTLATLPAVVCAVIMMVSGSLGAGVAVAGTFSLVRFRSVPGTAKEIGAIFLSMAIGLACGMGYPGFAALLTILLCGATLLYDRINLGGKRSTEEDRILQITVPESLDYVDMFDDLFARYTRQHKLVQVKTTNLGSLNRLTYQLTLQKPNTEKELIDELRCRNGNLEISLRMPETPENEL